MFITLEGPEGSGKSTQARLLHAHLVAQGLDAVLTREPGGTRIGEQVRAIVHSHHNVELAAIAECLLYNAARAQVVDEIIRPALERGKLVVCDRYADSTLAYQGYGRQLDLESVRRVIHFATGGLKPDLTFYLQVSIPEGMARRVNGQERGDEFNRMDAQAREFYERVQWGYEELMRAEPNRWRRIDGSRSIDEVQTELRCTLDLALENYRRTRKETS